jgi:citrate/tricarballylate utilization protein
MLELDLTRELARQLAVCNACRYCEGFCAVFGAAELRGAIGSGEAAYLANLCHDCRMCYDACMFTPPHEYALNVPAAMADARAGTYAAYGTPVTLASLFRRPVAAAAIAACAATLAIAAAVTLHAGAGALRPQLGPGAFYRLVPYAAMIATGVAVAAFAVVAVALSARAFARDIGRGARFAGPASIATAVREALELTYLKGGGAGCYDEDRGSARRRLYHAMVFWGFGADAVATVSAAILQDVLHRAPPYPFLSVPVVFGTAGGIALAIGAAGLAVVKTRGDARPTSPRMIALDRAFLGLLELVALSGLALLAFRSSAAMGTLLVVHLGAVAGLAITTPYGKFVHAVYRFIALVKNAHDRRSRDVRS